MSNEDEPYDLSIRRWACAAHLGAIFGVMHPIGSATFLIAIAPAVVPVAIWHFRRSLDPYLEEHSRRSVNFQLSMCLYFAIASGIVGALKLIFIGYLFFWLPGVIHYIQVLLPLVAALRAYDIDDFDYPFAISFLKKPQQDDPQE